MKIKTVLLVSLSCLTSAFFGQVKDNTNDKDKFIESNVISLVGREGFEWKSLNGDFLLKPYMLVFTKAQFQYVDNEGLELADEDNIVNSGFGIPAAYLGFAGKAFDVVTYNFTIDASKGSSAALINQAWIDLNISNELRITAGKFKTPMHRGYLVRAGQTLFPVVPFVLSTQVNLPYSLNAVNPVLSTGFDVGAMVHGLFDNRFQYQLGIFNGNGVNNNSPVNTYSDDLGIPALLYSARFAYMPYGPMPIHEGDPDDRNNLKFLAAVSASYNVEANYETSNDLRLGAELSLLKNNFYFSSEFTFLNMSFIERQKISPDYNFWGAYAQCGYFVTDKLQPVIRIEAMDRNSQKDNGILISPSAGINYFIVGQNLKLQVMYQYLTRSGHDDEYAANDDDNGLAESSFIAQLQFSF
jgi:hypothetical protein